MKTVVVKVPAKLIISGEHSVLFNKTAVACAVSIAMKIKIKQIKKPKIVVKGSGFRVNCKLKNFSIEKKNDDVLLEIIRQFCDKTKTPVSGLKITINSKIPMNCGMGSSACLVSGLVCGLNELYNTKLKPLTLIAIATQLECLFHGKSSGIDTNTVIRGGVLSCVKGKYDKLAHSFDEIYIVNTGRPNFSTKNIVNYVMDNFPKTSSIWKDFSKTSLSIIEGIESGKAIYNKIATNEKLLEKIGIVSSKVQNFIQILLNYSIYAKVCGAGSIAEKEPYGSGVVAIFQKLSPVQRKELKKVCSKFHYKMKKIHIVNSGIEIECF